MHSVFSFLLQLSHGMLRLPCRKSATQAPMNEATKKCFVKHCCPLIKFLLACSRVCVINRYHYLMRRWQRYSNCHSICCSVTLLQLPIHCQLQEPDHPSQPHPSSPHHCRPNPFSHPSCHPCRHSISQPRCDCDSKWPICPWTGPNSSPCDCKGPCHCPCSCCGSCPC